MATAKRDMHCGSAFFQAIADRPGVLALFRRNLRCPARPAARLAAPGAMIYGRTRPPKSKIARPGRVPCFTGPAGPTRMQMAGCEHTHHQALATMVSPATTVQAAHWEISLVPK